MTEQELKEWMVKKIPLGGFSDEFYTDLAFFINLYAAAQVAKAIEPLDVEIKEYIKGKYKEVQSELAAKDAEIERLKTIMVQMQIELLQYNAEITRLREGIQEAINSLKFSGMGPLPMNPIPKFTPSLEFEALINLLTPSDGETPEAPTVDERGISIYDKTPCPCGEYHFAPKKEVYFDGDEIEDECPECGTEAEIEVSVEMRYKIKFLPKAIPVGFIEPPRAKKKCTLCNGAGKMQPYKMWFMCGQCNGTGYEK